MNIKKTVNIKISEEELKNIVASHFSEMLNKKITPENVSFSLGSHLEGFGENEYLVYNIENCCVTYEEK